MEVVFLLCAAFTLGVAAADPVLKRNPEPVGGSAPVEQRKTDDVRRGELLYKVAEKMTKWKDGSMFPAPDNYSGNFNCLNNNDSRPQCFTFIRIPMAWVDAEKHCWQYGGNLASIHDQRENDFVRDLVTNARFYNLFWIGGYAVRRSDWLWSDGSSFDWPVSCPSGWWRNCLSLNEHGSVDPRHCEERHPFVCRMRACPTFSQ